jgi:hypothetical protein
MQIRSLTVLVCLCVSAAARVSAAATITVPNGGDLQAAINAAAPGDTILVAAGATFDGTFTLPAKHGSAYITIRSSAPDSALPPDGTRITPAYAGLLPKIRSNRNGPAFKTAAGASYWRLQFLEMLPAESTSSANLLELGGAGSSQATLDRVPHHLVIDHCYIHGVPSWNQRRGIALNSAHTTIANSYVSEIKGVNEDTQAIAGWNGPGPFLIENNYLEAAAENVLFGGDDPAISGLVPSDITLRRNLISKPPAWRTSNYTLKNLLELKNADRVLIEGNIIENNWAAGQQGYSILLTPRNQNGTAPSTVVQNVTIRHNVIRHVAAVFNIAGYDDINTSRQTNAVSISNNLVYDVSSSYATSGNQANGWFAVVGNRPRNVTFDHNTIDNDGNDTICLYGSPMYGLVITNNLLRDNAYGIFGGNSQEGVRSLAMYAPDAYVAGNAIGGATATLYPLGNLFPSLAQWLADFVDRASGDYRLRSTSAVRGLALDGTDPGVAFAALDAAMAGNGVSPSDPETTPSPSGSTPFSGSPIAVPGRIQAEDYDNGGDGVAYHDTSAGNSGGAYRSDNVDVKATSDSGGSYNLKSVRAGEWVAYTVTVSAAGSYTPSFRIASSGTGGTVHLSVDGANVSGAIALPDTGGWDVWKTVTANAVALPAGTHVLTLSMDANGSGGTIADLNWIELSSGATPPGGGTNAYSGTPVAVPGRIQAENYDKGGDGTGYHDTTAGNSGGAYRSDDVDVKATTDSSGSYNVKSVRAGEWLAYTVNVASAGTYQLALRLASSGTGGTMHVAVDGKAATGGLALPDTGGWGVWKTVTVGSVSLPAGTHVLTLVMDANGSGGTVADLNWIDLTASAPATAAYGGTPVALPGVIQLENFDLGGSGSAYHDTTAGNSGGAYRSEDVDIKATTDTSGGYNVKSVRAGEWLSYTVNVASAGTYTLDLRMASSGGGGTMHLTVDGVDVTGPCELPDTGGWSSWQTVSKPGVTLPAGTHVLKLVVDANGDEGSAADLNWLRLR